MVLMNSQNIYFKRLFALIVCFVFTFCNSILLFAESDSIDNEGILGDVNNDGVLTAMDASIVLNAVLHNIELTDEQIELSRVTGNKDISVNDASAILQKVLRDSYKFIPYEDESTTNSTTSAESGTEVESSSNVETESSLATETESSSAAETESSLATETESSSAAETESSSIAETESSSAAETESSSTAEIESSSAAETESSSTAEIESSSAAETESSSTAEIESSSAAETESSSAAETESSSESTSEEHKLIASLKSDDVTGTSYTADTQIGQFTIKSSGGEIKVDSVNKSYGNESYTKVIKLGGTGSATNRSIAVNVKGNVTVKVVVASSNLTAIRNFVMSDGVNPVVLGSAGGELVQLTGTYNAETGTTLYFYSESSGMNVYKIEVYSDDDTSGSTTESESESTTENSGEISTESSSEPTTGNNEPSDNSKFNLTGFGSNDITGGGVVSESDTAAYVKVSNAQQFDKALYDARNGKIKVIEITADLNLGSKEIGSGYDFKRIAAATYQARNNDILKETGVSVVNIQNIDGLTIFSKNAAKIKHACFVVKGCNNIIIRNLEFDEIWEWDEGEPGNSKMEPGAYDRNDWDYITFTNTTSNNVKVATTNAWVDHCTFHKAYDGIIDIKEASNNIVISWCKFLGDDMSENSWVTKQINQLEKTYQEDLKNGTQTYPLYYHLRKVQNYLPQQIIQVQAPQKKAHLVGSDNKDTADNAKLSVTIYNCYYKEIQDRIPRLRGGNAHIFNTVIDSTNIYKNKAWDPKVGDNNSNFHFGLTNQALLSTCGGALKAENIYMIDVSSPMSYEQDKGYPGKLLAQNIKYQIHKSGSDTEYEENLDSVNSTDTDIDKNSNFKLKSQGSAMQPFSWNEGNSDYVKNGELTYNYNLIDTNALYNDVVPFTGAGSLVNWTEEWLKTSY